MNEPQTTTNAFDSEIRILIEGGKEKALTHGIAGGITLEKIKGSICDLLFQ